MICWDCLCLVLIRASLFSRLCQSATCKWNLSFLFTNRNNFWIKNNLTVVLHEFFFHSSIKCCKTCCQIRTVEKFSLIYLLLKIFGTIFTNAATRFLKLLSKHFFHEKNQTFFFKFQEVSLKINLSRWVKESFYIFIFKSSNSIWRLTSTLTFTFLDVFKYFQKSEFKESQILKIMIKYFQKIRVKRGKCEITCLNPLTPIALPE